MSGSDGERMAGALKGAGALVQGISGFQAGKANQRLARREARGAVNAGVAQEADIRAQARRTAGEAIASMGANGGGLGTGSALDLLQESILESELDRLRVRRGAANQAAGLRYQGRIAMRQGIFDAVGGAISAASSVAGGAGGGGG